MNAQGEVQYNYQNLPFHFSDVIEIFPVVKHLDIQNSDVRSLLQNAKAAYKESYFERAFELYS